MKSTSDLRKTPRGGANAEPAEGELVDKALERKRRARDAAARRRLAERLIPGLPVDADALETRVATPRVGTLLETVVAKLIEVKEPFFDTVCTNWSTACPDFPARPGRYRDGHLFLYVRTSGQVFGLRSKLPKVKKALQGLPGAPKRLTVHLEVHGTSNSH